MVMNDVNDDMFPGEDDNEEEFWFEAPGQSKASEPEDAPDYNFRDDARRTYMIVGSIFALFLFAGVLWYLYYQKNLRDAENPPLIAAETNPIRERPDDPGGMDVPHQDKLIFGKINGEGTEMEDSVQPGPEQPIEDFNEPTIEDLIEETEPVPQPVRMAEVTNPPVSTAGNFMIQLGAYSERKSADDAWAEMQSQHTQLLALLVPDIDTVTTSTGHTLHRLRSGYFETRAEAERLCSQLKQRGQECLATTR